MRALGVGSEEKLANSRLLIKSFSDAALAALVKKGHQERRDKNNVHDLVVSNFLCIATELRTGLWKRSNLRVVRFG